MFGVITNKFPHEKPIKFLESLDLSIALIN